MLSTKQALASVKGVFEVSILAELVGKQSATLKATVIKDQCYTLLDDTPKTEIELFHKDTFEYKKPIEARLSNLPADFKGCTISISSG